MGHLAKIVEDLGHIPSNHSYSSDIHVGFFKDSIFFSFHFLDCFGTCLCCDNQGWLSWINYTVEVNFPFEVLTIPNVLESVISFAKEIFLFGNVGSFSTLLFWQHYADLIRTRAIGNLGRQRDVKPILCWYVLPLCTFWAMKNWLLLESSKLTKKWPCIFNYKSWCSFLYTIPLNFP